MKSQHTGYAWHIAKTKFVTINSIVMLGEKLAVKETKLYENFTYSPPAARGYRIKLQR